MSVCVQIYLMSKTVDHPFLQLCLYCEHLVSDAHDVVIVVMSQPDAYDLSLAESLRDSVYKQSEKLRQVCRFSTSARNG